MPFSSDMVKNSIRAFLVVSLSWPHSAGCGSQKKAGTRGPRLFPSPGRQPADGRFIWQLVGVLETYGSICLIGTKV